MAACRNCNSTATALPELKMHQMCLRWDLWLGALSFFPPQSADSETRALLQFCHFFFIGAWIDLDPSRLSMSKKKLKCMCSGNKNASKPTRTRPEASNTSVITHLSATQLQSDCLFFRRRILHCARVTFSSSASVLPQRTVKMHLEEEKREEQSRTPRHPVPPAWGSLKQEETRLAPGGAGHVLTSTIA